MRVVPLCALVLTIGALAIGAPALARESGAEMLEKALAGRTAGPPESCINLARSPHSTIIDEHTILYRAGGTIYVNTIPGGCGGMREGAALVSRTPSTRLCRGDIVTVIDPPMPGTYGSCPLGDFVPYRKPR